MQCTYGKLYLWASASPNTVLTCKVLTSDMLRLLRYNTMRKALPSNHPCSQSTNYLNLTTQSLSCAEEKQISPELDQVAIK